MPDFKKIVVIGGGLAGVAAAYWARRLSPDGLVVLYEKTDRLLGWNRRPGSGGPPLGLAGAGLEPAEADFPRGWPLAAGILRKWPGTATRDWLSASGISLEEAPGGAFRIAGDQPPGESLRRLLEASGVTVRTGFALEALSPQPRGGFRIWSREGEQDECQRLCLATGGERNHGMALVAEHAGIAVRQVIPAYLRLRAASPRIGERLGPMERQARVRCPRTSLEALGTVRLSARGLEGEGISRLSSRLCERWRQGGYRFQLELDWVPDQRPAGLRADLSSRSVAGGRKPVGSEPLYGFGQRSWETILEMSRIDPRLSWSRLRSRQIQTLLHRLKAQGTAISGMGLPAGERAWAGGIAPEDLDIDGGRCPRLPGLHLAGEILDLLAVPGGIQSNLAWASGYLAGSGMALDG
jgi:predicted Rossmann fold flavoprotein